MSSAQQNTGLSRTLFLVCGIIGVGILGTRFLGAASTDMAQLVERARDPIALIAVPDRKALADFDYRDAQGKVHHLKDEIGQRPVLIHFWATWCGPCLPELPGLDALTKSQNAGLTVLPLSLDHDAIPKVQKFFADKNFNNLPILAAEANAPIPQALPSSILVDKSGRIAWQTIGAHPWDGPDIVQAIEKLN